MTKIETLKKSIEGRRICIAVSGKSGCGNTTTSSLIARTLGLNLINYTFRSLAEERGVSLKEIMRQAAASDEVDRIVDRRQVELAQEGNCVLASRLAIWLTRASADLTVYLHAPDEVRVQRIHQREGGDINEILEFTRERDRQDHERYLKLYNIDNDSYDFADLILDAGSNNPNQLLDLVVDELLRRFGPGEESP
ncbi:(d)CMP kinase [Salinispira pacifica]|uniref:Cytidylate kinase n=1 Tax=Salinispira pacifica TaxID=1307761 RepID=V5WLW1_9SPIO|nr:cytidylate kinase family protein [Salinispira pacifica]AHC16071.1 Cytidylate kinase [Salinispira pacifica]